MASPTQIGLSPQPAKLSQPNHLRFFGFAVAAGLLICLLAAFTFLRLPAAHTPTLSALSIRALAFVVIGALAGTTGSWYYWKNSTFPIAANPPVPFPLIALACAAGWVWVPAVVLLGREDSPLTAVVAVLGAAILAFALRRAIPATTSIPQPPDTDLFAAALRTPPRQARGHILAVGIYIAAYELYLGWILDASVLLALCAFVFIWTLTKDPPDTIPARSDRRKQQLRAARRLALVALPAFLITLFSLLYGVGHRNRLEAAAALANAPAQAGDAGQTAEAATRPSANGISGYESIILWPFPQKREILPPLPQPASLLAPGTTEPLIIRFDGPYFYFQPPNKRPSPAALQVHGTPLIHDFQSNNFMPLVMEAHQTLGSAIPLARCREIQLGILNGDNRPGVINVAVLLSHSSAPSNQVYLGQKPVLSSQPANFAFKATSAPETLRFPIPSGPAAAKVRSFDQITVMILPDDANYDQGSKVAIQQFELIPH